MDVRNNVLFLILVLGVPGCVTDYVGSETNICMSTCLNNFQSMLQGVSDQATACAYVPTYVNCLKSSCNLGDLSPYLSSLQEVLSSSGFTCDLSRSIYSSDQVQVSPMCIATCESAFQSHIVAASSQSMACAIAQSYISCLETSCNADSSQFVSHMNLGLTQQGYTPCDGYSDVADAEPEAEPPSSSSAVSCSVLQVLAMATLTTKMSLWQFSTET
ncbi:uncharacterized protein LOC112569357 [Pomacea canaliculata]|uniref:uncharacterized protein LOC112569357 n=1 Tax=Pomacea canaliculata TaxID=400727 RepID=UPI000D73709E|nr:uncharacterized protein LOC112569357 [Pomacea canaliculata]